jgi:hypothetical protein
MISYLYLESMGDTMKANNKSRTSFLVRLDKRIWQRLKHLSAFEETSMSYFVRKFLRQGLNRIEKKRQTDGRVG